MTEAEWLACDNATLLLCHSPINDRRNPVSERKLILFGCAACRRLWYLFEKYDACANAVLTAEAFAEGKCSSSDLKVARMRVETEHPNLWWTAEYGTHIEQAAFHAAADAAGAIEQEIEHPWPNTHKHVNYLCGMKAELVSLLCGFMALGVVDQSGALTFPLADSPDWPRDVVEHAYVQEEIAQCHLLRDIFGNPFRPVTPDSTWLTSNVTALAQAIYDERAFDRMPILADALEDAGCTNQEILAHCRGVGAHVRGCWVVDLLLGKE